MQSILAVKMSFLSTGYRGKPGNPVWLSFINLYHHSKYFTVENVWWTNKRGEIGSYMVVGDVSLAIEWPAEYNLVKPQSA
jgi:hypothetical protein